VLNRKLLLVVLYGAALLFQGCASTSMQMTASGTEDHTFASQAFIP